MRCLLATLAVGMVQAAPVVIDVGKDPSSDSSSGEAVARKVGGKSPQKDATRRLFSYKANVVNSDIVMLMHAEVCITIVTS